MFTCKRKLIYIRNCFSHYSEKNRAPAWCDRVLWKGDRISQLEYNNVMSLRLSDHKPVYAVFSTGVTEIKL